MCCDGLSLPVGVQHFDPGGFTASTKKPPLSVVVGQVRDRLISRLNGKKRFVVTQEEPHGALRIEGYNSAIDDAIRVVMEEL